MAVTMYGGGTWDYLEIFGVPTQVLTDGSTTGGQVSLDGGATVYTDLRASDGTTVVSRIGSDAKGFYRFGVNNWNGPVSVNFGQGWFLVHPADMSSRLVSLETTVAALVAGGGGGGGGAVASVAGKTGTVTLVTSDVGGLSTTLAGKADLVTGFLSLSQLPQKYASILQQPGPATIGRVRAPVHYPSTIGVAVVEWPRPPIGSAGAVTLKYQAHNGAPTSLGSVSAPALSKRVVVTGLTQAIANGDHLMFDVTGVGSTEPGGDITVTFLGVGAPTPPSSIAAPGAITGLVVTATSSTSNTVSWTAPASGTVTEYKVYRTDAGGPLHWIADVDATSTSILDVGLDAGTAYTYGVSAANDDAAAAPVMSASFAYMSSAELTSDWVTLLGSNAGTAISMSGSTVNKTTGSVGGSSNGDPQDPVAMVWKGTTNNHTAWRETFPIQFTESTDVEQILLSSGVLSAVNTTLTNFIQIQLLPGFYRVGIKAASYNGGAFFNVTSSGTSPVQAVTPSGTTSGNVAWTSGMSLATKYYVTIEALVIGTGTYNGAAVGAGQQVINIYLATATGSPVLQNQILLNATQRSAIAAGRLQHLTLGSQATTGVANHVSHPTNGNDWIVTPLSAAGT